MCYKKCQVRAIITSLISGYVSVHTAEEVVAALAVRQILLSHTCFSTYHSPSTSSTDWYTSDCNFVRNYSFLGATHFSLLRVMD